MSKGTLAARVAAVEAERRARGLEAWAGSLSAAERAELARLEAEEAIEGEKIRSGTMTGEECDAWLSAHSIDGDDGRGDRLAELRRRARTPKQVAADDAEEAAIEAMSREELAAWLQDRIAR